MGWHTAWIAVESTDLDLALHALGWTRTGDTEDEHVDPGVVALRRGRWVVVFADGSEHRATLEADQALDASRGGRALYFTQTDFSMEAEIRMFEDGRETWSIVHANGEPAVAGAPPGAEALIAHYRAQNDAQAPDDKYRADYLYEVPPELGRKLVGFRHDDPEADDGFHAVERA